MQNPLEADRVAFDALLLQLGRRLVQAVVNHYSHGFAAEVGEVSQFARRSDGTEISNIAAASLIANDESFGCHPCQELFWHGRRRAFEHRENRFYV